MKTGRGGSLSHLSFESGGQEAEHKGVRLLNATKSFGRSALKAAMISVPAATALTFASTEVESKSTPVEASYSFNMKGATIADLGLPGRAYLPFSVGPIGLSVDVGTIPSQEGSISEKQIYRELEAAYLNIDKVADAVVKEIVRETGRNFLIYSIGGTALAMAAFRSNPRLRKHAGKAGLAGLSAMALTVGHQSTTPPATGDYYLDIADGTPVEGISADGAPVQILIEKALPAFEDLRQRQILYMDDFMQKVGTSLERQAEDICQGDEGHTAVLVMSDTHASEFAVRMLNKLYARCEPDVVIHAGDLVDRGRSGEAYYVNQYVDSLPSDTEAVLAPGNHDSDEIIEHARQTPLHIVDGEVVKLKGVSLLGGVDPTYSPLVGQKIDRNPDDDIYTQEDLGKVLAKKAANERTDIVVVHQPRAAKSFLEHSPSNRIPASLVVNGHFHEQVGPEIKYNDDDTHTVVVQMGTAAGKTPLTSDRYWQTGSTPFTTAPYLMAYLDNKTKLVSRFVLIEVTPDGRVIVDSSNIEPRKFTKLPPGVY